MAKKAEDIKEEQVQEEVTEETTEELAEEIATEAEDETSDEETEDIEEEEEKGVKKLFAGKKDKENEKLKEQVAELNDKVMRQMAEFENFRNRTQKEKDAMFEMGAKSIIEKMLPIIDNFERGLAGLDEEKAKEPFAEGMGMVYKQMMTEFEKLNVKPIEAVGQEFNPDFHQAVMHVEDEEQGENVIVEELQKGYTYNDTVVRYSMVKVAN